MLEDQIAIVTGAANGIGRDIALRFAEYGADVVVADLDRKPIEGSEPTDKLVESKGQRSQFLQTDVSDPDAIDRLFTGVEDTFGRLDILVNNAGAAWDSPLLDLEYEDWQRTIDVNLTGTFLACKRGLPLLLSNEDGGVIINISSTAGLRGSEGLTAFGASKAGMTNFTRVLALDYGRQGLRANSIHPSPIETPGLKKTEESEDRDDDKTERIVSGVPQGRIGYPEDVSGAAVFLASDLASYVNGHQLVVDGGLMAKYY